MNSKTQIEWLGTLMNNMIRERDAKARGHGMNQDESDRHILISVLDRVTADLFVTEKKLGAALAALEEIRDYQPGTTAEGQPCGYCRAVHAVAARALDTECE